MNIGSKKDSRFGKLLIKEPREPKVPIHIDRAERRFLKSSTMKLSSTNERKEKLINLARKKLEYNNLEDKLLGSSKDKARKKRLDKKNKSGIYRIK